MLICRWGKHFNAFLQEGDTIGNYSLQLVTMNTLLLTYFIVVSANHKYTHDIPDFIYKRYLTRNKTKCSQSASKNIFHNILLNID
jgi:hypothetical protein